MTMLLALALQAAAAAAPVGAPVIDVAPAIGSIGKQDLPAKGCAAFLWSVGGDNRLVAMAVADPAQLRLSLDGRTVDLVRAGQLGQSGFGFAETNDYAGTGVAATLTMTVAVKAELTQGAQVPQATLRIDRPGQDTIVMPVAGLIGCRT